MSGYYGQYEYSLDDKGRVSLPAAFRKEAGESSFVLLAWDKDFLSLFPQAAWEVIQARMPGFKEQGPDHGKFARRISASAVEVTPDKQGRILVPTRLQEWAQLKGDVLIVGNITTIELWNPDVFLSSQATVDDAAFQAAAYSLLGH